MKTNTRNLPGLAGIGALAVTWVGCGGAVVSERTQPEPARESASPVVLPPDEPGDGFSLAIAEPGAIAAAHGRPSTEPGAQTVLLELPASARHYAILADEGCGSIRADSSPMMGGSILVGGVRPRVVAVAAESGVLAIDLPDVPRSATLAVRVSSVPRGVNVHGEHARACESAITWWAGDPSHRSTADAAHEAVAWQANVAATEVQADADALAEIQAAACSAEHSAVIDQADTYIDQQMRAARLARTGRARAVGGTGREPHWAMGPSPMARLRYHVLIGSWRPVTVSVTRAGGTPVEGSASLYERLLSLGGWHVASAMFEAAAGENFEVRPMTRGCVVLYVYAQRAD